MQHPVRCIALIGACLMLGTTGCTIKATLEQITDTTSNITGTTSGAAWWSEDGQIKPDFKLTAFVTFTQANLSQDLAAGKGEYLGSVSRLLGIPTDRQPAFFATAQAKYAQLVDRDSASLLSLLHETSQPFVY